mgnify:CR=1 FL=1
MRRKEIDTNSATVFYSYEKTIGKLSELINPNVGEREKQIIKELEKQTTIQQKQKEELEKQTAEQKKQNEFINSKPNANEGSNSVLNKIKQDETHFGDANFSKFLTLPIDFLKEVIASSKYAEYADSPKIPFPWLGDIPIAGAFWFTSFEPYKYIAIITNGYILFMIFEQFKQMVEDIKTRQ